MVSTFRDASVVSQSCVQENQVRCTANISHTKACRAGLCRSTDVAFFLPLFPMIMIVEQGLRDVCRSVRIGKILIQRDEETALPKLYYAKFPPDIASRYCLLLDPMLATGGSAIKAIETLIDYGVAEERILFLNLISCPEGIAAVVAKFPTMKIVTAEIDAGLDEKLYINPGLGDFGCRYFGTDK
ncbi:unnamed protein product [Mortierella alpina]